MLGGSQISIREKCVNTQKLLIEILQGVFSGKKELLLGVIIELFSASVLY